ncbi:hypothetical protein BCR32DRAFT_282587 [Anaeromyces robustus]|uniref:Uncharacterized protein n=1 Tax=Anaeromyces robustus TaxID=1754192 RepID=A0A1Y1WXL4_9FUNG|nr:hypothetical protein BCR32DRAFT_282587 [Anaeromyces robustus]|eukprot:ORX78125.1 hypothetical protein BCR32DRAFT_282587 [Anaeromyces robustus]
MLIACKRQHILFNKFKTNLSTCVDADNTIGHPSRGNTDPSGFYSNALISKEFISSSKACVKINSISSDSFRVNENVRQGISIENEFCCDSMFVDNIILCVLNKLLRFVSKWIKGNDMNLGINKYATKVFKTNKALLSIQGFLKNDLIHMPLKRTLFSAKVIGQYSKKSSKLLNEVISDIVDVLFMEFPENNKTKRYIHNHCIYDDKNNKIINCENYIGGYNNDYIIDLSCTNDSECFYNKCIDNYCVFNEEPSSTHCDYVHKGFAMFQYTFLHCGKTYEDRCKHNYECSSYSCYKGICSPDFYVISDSTKHKDKLKRKQQYNNLENDTKK